MTTFPHVLAPARIGPVELRNHLVLAPMTTRMADLDGSVGEAEHAFLVRRAQGGVGLVTTGAMLVTRELETPAARTARIDRDEHVPALGRLVDAVHAAGAAISVQLTAGLGRVGGPEPGRPVPVSASPVPWLADERLLCRALGTEEVRLLVRRFGEAASRVAEAGADAVDVHAHAGHLLDQFLTPAWNRRTDRYGGSTAARTRVLLEVVAAVRAAAPGLAVTVRLAGDQGVLLGRGLEESLEVARLLVPAGVDMICVDAGVHETRERSVPPYHLGDAPSLPAAAAFRRVVRVPVMVSGSVTPELAEKALADGLVDLVAMGRQLVADPDLPRHLAQDRPGRVRPCVRCNELCLGEVDAGRPLGCAVNAQAGAERRRTVPRAPVPKRVVVVGGGPAGLEAARVAALRGHAVDLYERRPHLGGMLRDAGAADVKRDLRRLVDWWEVELRRLGVTLHLGRSVDPGSAVLRQADEVVVATGSLPVHPVGVGGLGREDVLDVVDVHSGAPVGHHVVVAGGGLSGMDAALDLAVRGHRVTVVERTDAIAADVVPVNRAALLARFEELGVEVLTGHAVRSVGPDGVELLGPDGAVHVAADTVVSAYGTRPDRTLAGGTAAEDPHVHVVGDCVRPGMLADAVHSAFRAAVRL